MAAVGFSEVCASVGLGSLWQYDVMCANMKIWTEREEGPDAQICKFSTKQNNKWQFCVVELIYWQFWRACSRVWHLKCEESKPWWSRSQSKFHRFSHFGEISKSEQILFKTNNEVLGTATGRVDRARRGHLWLWIPPSPPSVPSRSRNTRRKRENRVLETNVWNSLRQSGGGRERENEKQK